MLQKHFNSEDSPENQVEILDYALENVDIVIHSPAGNLIEHVHHEEGVENDSVHGHLGGGDVVSSGWRRHQVVWLIKEDKGAKVEE